MKVANQTHPTQEELAAFSTGKLDTNQSGQIEQHLAECESCCQVLKMLPDNDTLVSLLRDPEAETSVSPDQPDASAKVAQSIPASSEQPTIPPAHSPTELTEETDLVLTQGLPAELSEHPRYDVLELLGKGGMGDVYKAHHRMMNRPVALKLINGQLVQSDAAVKRFHREVQAAARLSHPNIVTAYDAEQAGDVHYLVMEFVDGMDLAEVVSQRGPLPVAEACEFIRQAAEGLQHAHEHGMVHRDIKPQNLMVQSSPHAPREEARHAKPDGYDVVKILDFGLANFATETAAEQINETVDKHDTPRVPTHLTMMGSMMGTPDYISPEQARDAHSADIRSDIYSLGCTLYCLLSGKPPFASGSMLDKVMAHVEREPKPLSDFRDDVPAGVVDLLRRMMAKNPDERFQTPAELVEALLPFSSEASAAPAKHVSPSRSPFVPMAIVASGLLALFIAFGAVIVVATGRGRVVIQSEVDDVRIAVMEGGQQIDMIDLKTGSQVKWLTTGKYELQLVGDNNDVTLEGGKFQMTRLGRVIVTARWNSEGRGVIRSFDTTQPTITRDGIEVADGGWKITAAGPRTVRLFETPMPPMKPGPYFYRAKLKSENVTGRAYLEMWSRFPGQGEFFSKGFDKAITGTNGWAEYEVPLYLKTGQQPDLVKLNLTIEGGGTVWIKDVELRGRSLTPSHSGVKRTGAPPKTGILTSPPAVPPGGLPIGRNLITDPSLEDTSTGALPKGWFAWLDDGPNFNCEVVEGGVTGKHCLQISGTGTRGVVFATSIPLDRTKRYALKGQVKVEGEAGTWAVIKLNYFNNTGWLGVDDRVGVTTSDGKWKSFEKTDMADRYPDATLLVPTCHIEGNGTACFDDLEVVAFDRDKLPADFDVKHGKNNRLTADLDFDRWVGRWESTTIYKPTVASPSEQTIKGEVVVRKMLDDKFLFWQFTGETGDPQYTVLLTLDPHVGGYHIWVFGSGGEAFERTGQWDAASQALTLNVTRPTGVNGTSTDRFVNNDRIESTLLIKSTDGQITRDMRATWVRKSSTVDNDISLSKAPVTGIEELALLNKMAGDWTIRQTNKPSIWFADGETATFTEHTAWAIGGRFLLFRSYAGEGEAPAEPKVPSKTGSAGASPSRLKTLAFMTWDEKEKSYHYWHFASDVAGGQWRITWDASSRGFHWRSIDMPAGWIGTGFNRWIDDDTFDNQALIKDEQGRVLLNSQQEKKRVK